MHTVEVRGELRHGTGKGAAHRVRAAGKVPGVVYGGGDPVLAISLDAKTLDTAMRKHGRETFLLDLKIPGYENREMKALIKEMQRDPLSTQILHVDLLHVSMTQTVDVQVPIRVHGTAIGVKEGGILEQILREVEVKCLAGSIPEHFDVDVSEMTRGDSVHVSDLVLPDGIKVVTPADRVVVTVLAKAIAEAAAEAAAAPAEADKGAKAEEPPAKS